MTSALPSTPALLELSLGAQQCCDQEDAYQQLLSLLRQTIHCDAVALLLRHGERLTPVALQGLSRDTLGRRFIIAEHPRFARICAATDALRFASDDPSPDPYDGLLLALEGDLPVHSCMGLPLIADGQCIAVVTLDSLAPGQFEALSARALQLVCNILSNAVSNIQTLQRLKERASHAHALVEELTTEALQKDGGELIGNSPAMAQLQQEMNIVADSELTTLIVGETGTGKELVARHLHRMSSRRNGPLVYVNCAALPDNLIESELFGHAKGAFTGAHQRRAGKFVMANGGSLFLDEIGELPLAAQSKLLRALQSQEVQPVGDDSVQTVDVRIIAATNRRLNLEVGKGRFRADLYHRLSVYPLQVPPLRQREGDVALLSGFFVEIMRRKLGITQLKLAPSAQRRLSAYTWPGNVRELEHCISRAALKARSRSQRQLVVIDDTDIGALEDSAGDHSAMGQQQPAPAELPLSLGEAVSEQTLETGLKDATEAFQRRCIVGCLQQHQGNWSATARALAMDRANLSRLARRLGIRVDKQIRQTRPAKSDVPDG
ncbi:nitric oxide reductase transcription regulator [Bacterioplanes sanyensis]|uniref:Nitric oxide reductase transcription regulator n=1 Tax=Bacterioplanes sanyensis TaxID=1249553 RepID=A0A222FKH5_9GAMM|nr:nitric oxide reductase transcriptional regulator NorR [Bacterioplanes sanyensis]ASP39014.1 nitric oxide reductase transcription regulator [Bacterioplanes sanyensis]